MARFHINGKGDAGPCRAKNGNCPFGGDSEHYDTAEEARAAFEQEMGGGFRQLSSQEATDASEALAGRYAEYLQMEEDLKKYQAEQDREAFEATAEEMRLYRLRNWDGSALQHNHPDLYEREQAAMKRKLASPLSADRYDVPEELREAAQRVLNRYKVDAVGKWSFEAMSRKEEQAYLEMSNEEKDALRVAEDKAVALLAPQVDFGAIMGTPCKLTRKETNRLRKSLSEYGLTEEQFNAYLTHSRKDWYGGQGDKMHASRLQKVSLAHLDGADDFRTAAYIHNAEFRAREQAAAKAAADPHGVYARNLAHLEDERSEFLSGTSTPPKDAEHFHGSWMGKSGGAPKRPDPQFIEALRKMYLGKFGKTPEEDGVDTGTLLAMFNKGELG